MTISRESTEETPVREVRTGRGLGRYRLKYGTRGAPVERDPGEPPCYTDEWKRTNPDFAVYLPERFIGRDSDNVHFLVTVTPGGDLLGSWTQGTYEGADNECVVAARSCDGGETWSAPIEIDGPDLRNQVATYATPVVSDSGRIYYFYGKMRDTALLNDESAVWRGHTRTNTALTCRVSDDDGRTWSDTHDIPLRRTRYDSDDPNVPPGFIIWQKPIRDSQGRWVVSYSTAAHPSKWTNRAVAPSTRCMFIRFDNINEGPDLKNLSLTFLPENEEGLSAPNPEDPSVARSWESSLALLPDGRLLATMTTALGSPWYSVSSDDGTTWREPEPLRYRDGGERVLHGQSPGPLFSLEDGRYLLQYHNNEGSGSRGPEPIWGLPSAFSRRSMFFAVGEFRPDAHQPIWFSQPKLIADTDGVPAGIQNRIECGTYSSLTERQGRRILWYPDRKHFLLGRLVPDELLADMNVPRP